MLRQNSRLFRWENLIDGRDAGDAWFVTTADYAILKSNILKTYAEIRPRRVVPRHSGIVFRFEKSQFALARSLHYPFSFCVLKNAIDRMATPKGFYGVIRCLATEK